MPLVHRLTFWQRFAALIDSCEVWALYITNVDNPIANGLSTLDYCKMQTCSILSNFAIEILTRSLKCVQCTWKNVAHVWRTVKEVFEEQPYAVIEK